MRKPRKYKSPIVGFFTNEEWEELKQKQQQVIDNRKKADKERLEELRKKNEELKSQNQVKGTVIRRPRRS